MIRRSACVLAFALMTMLVCAVAAHAHGELEGADPAPNSHLKAAPSDVTMTFTEEPSNDSVIDVTDGCGNDVVRQSVVDGNDFVARLSDGQPGKWAASFRVISAEDGHLTKGTYNFEVAGKKDCSPDKDGKADGKDGGDSTTGPGGDGSNASDNEPGGGSDFPVVPVVIGAVVLIAIGVIVRRASAR